MSHSKIFQGENSSSGEHSKHLVWDIVQQKLVLYGELFDMFLYQQLRG